MIINTVGSVVQHKQPEPQDRLQMKGPEMTPEEQRSTLKAALAICRKLHQNLPDDIFILASEGRDNRYSIISLGNKADRQSLLANPSTHIRATITPTCLPDDIPDNLLTALHDQLDVAYTPNGKTYNAYDLGDFITRAKEAGSAPA